MVRTARGQGGRGVNVCRDGVGRGGRGGSRREGGQGRCSATSQHVLNGSFELEDGRAQQRLHF